MCRLPLVGPDQNPRSPLDHVNNLQASLQVPVSLASTAYSDRRNVLFTSPEYALSATNPENGTVTYTYNSDNTLHTKTDAKNQVFTYGYDSYKRLTQVQVGSTVLRTFMYDTNTLDSSFSGQYTQGRLVAVQNAGVHSTGLPGGPGGSNITVPSSTQFVEMYGLHASGSDIGQAACR